MFNKPDNFFVLTSAICTLFEGHYHYGLAALVNSVYKNGFQGNVYAGYKGVLPPWAAGAERNDALAEGATTMHLGKGVCLHFLPIQTEFHLTNYKPFFMLHLLENAAKDAEALAYFDPDIVLKCKWAYIQNWMQHGVALVHEIAEHDMPPTHPLRMEWKKVIRQAGRQTKRELYSYINAGFCGVARQHIEFLHAYCGIINTGIQGFGLAANQWDHDYDRTFLFYKQDQDALNIAAMCCESPISEMGPEAMDFIHGGFTMSHSIGSPKPWKKPFLLSSIKGNPPSLADKEYWANVKAPISNYPAHHVSRKRLAIKFASFISRFNRRG